MKPKRWLVTFVSHAEGPADVHYVDVAAAPSALAAVRAALRERPPLHDWAIARARAWPSRANTVEHALRRIAGAR